jgi:hypothetical protein
MAGHGYRVALLSEMPPEGKVGVSPVCILGVNINAGQEISLRLRTDDLKVGWWAGESWAWVGGASPGARVRMQSGASTQG